MTTGVYSAGIAFMQVVPAFRGVEEAMRDELRKIGVRLDSELEAGARGGLGRAGRAAGPAGRQAAREYTGAFNQDVEKHLSKALVSIPNKVGDKITSDWHRTMQALRSDIVDLTKEKVGFTIDEGTFVQSLENMRDRMRQLETFAPGAADFFDANRARQQLDQAMDVVTQARRRGAEAGSAFSGAFDTQFSQTVGKSITALRQIEVGADTTEAEQQLAQLRVDLEQLNGKRIGIDISSAEAMAELRRIEAELRALDSDDVDVRIRVDARTAASGIREFRDRTDEASDSLSNMERVASLTMSRLEIIIALGASFGSVFVPGIAAAAGALGFLGTSSSAAVSGVGVLALGLSGLGTAVQALDQYQQQQAKSQGSINQANRRLSGSTDAVRQSELALSNTRKQVAFSEAEAEQRVKDAAEGVARARHEAGVAARESARQVADAQRDLTRSELDAKEARAALNQVIKEAIQNERELTTALDRNQVDQQKAVTAQMRALDQLHALQANPRASEVELRTAKDNVDEQTVRLEELRDKRKELVTEQSRNAKLGVEADAKVAAARKRLDDAEQKADDNRVRLQRAKQDAAEREYDATNKITDARTRQDQAERERDRQRIQGQFQIATSLAAVTAAERANEQASEKMGLAGGAALDSVNTAMAQLSPTQQRFARFLFGLKDDLREVRAAAADPMLPGFQQAIEELLPLLPGVSRFIGAIGAQLGSMAVQAARALQGPVWRRFFDYIDRTAVPTMQIWFDIVSNVADGLLSLYLALTPFDGQIGRGLLQLSEDFSAWAEKLDKTKGYQDFLEYVRTNGPKVVDFLKDLGELAVRLVIALAPIGSIAVTVLDAIADGLNAIPLPVLTVLVAMVSTLALGVSTLGAVVRAQRLKKELTDIFGDRARSAVQKYAIDTGRAAEETGKFGKTVSTVTGITSTYKDKIAVLPDQVSRAFGDRSRGFVEKYAIQTGFASRSAGKFEKAIASAAGVAQASGQKISGLATKVGGVRGAFSSLGSFLGGPWGIAIGAVTVGATVLGEASAKYHADIQNMAEGLGNLGTTYADLQLKGKVGTKEASDQIRDLVANNPDLQKAALAVRDLGVSFDTLGSAAAGNKDDIDAMMTVLDTRIDQLEKKWKDDSNFLFTVFGKAAREDSDQLDRYRKLREALKDRATQAGIMAEATDSVTEADRRNAAITAIQNAHAREGSQAVGGLISAYDSYSSQVEKLTGFIDAFTNKQSTAGERSIALRDLLDQETSAMKGATDAADDYQRKMLDLSDSVKQNGTHLDNHSRSGLANRDALKAAASAIREMYIQDIAANLPIAQVTKRHNDRVKALKDEGAHLNLDTKETEKLITAYGDVPESVRTAIENQNFDKVYNQLKLAKFMQEALAKGWSLEKAKATWKAEEWWGKGFQGPVFIPARAKGGAISGPGTGTSDDVLMWGSDGEHVITAREVQKAGGHEQIYAWRRFLMSGGQLPGFAGGGPVLKNGLPAYAAGGQVTWPFLVDLSGTKVMTQAEIESSLWEGSGVLGSVAGGKGWAWQEAVLKAQFPNVRFTSTTGGSHAKNSWHYLGRAVDLVPHTLEIMKWIHDTYGANTLELIGPYDGLDIWHGRPHLYSEALRAQHRNHIHWAYDNGGWLMPGAQQVVNATGRPEPVLNAWQWSAVEQQNDTMRQLVAQANQIGGRPVGNTYNFEFADTTLDAARLRSMQRRDDAMARAGRPR